MLIDSCSVMSRKISVEIRIQQHCSTLPDIDEDLCHQCIHNTVKKFAEPSLSFIRMCLNIFYLFIHSFIYFVLP